MPIFFEPDKIHGTQGISVDGERPANARNFNRAGDKRFAAKLEGGGIFQRVRTLSGTGGI